MRTFQCAGGSNKPRDLTLVALLQDAFAAKLWEWVSGRCVRKESWTYSRNPTSGICPIFALC